MGAPMGAPAEGRNRKLLKRIGRGERIRTSDPLVPNQVLYQAEPLPDVNLRRERNRSRDFCGNLVLRDYSKRAPAAGARALVLFQGAGC